jgi:hypothetical protein
MLYIPYSIKECGFLFILSKIFPKNKKVCIKEGESGHTFTSNEIFPKVFPLFNPATRLQVFFVD